MQLHMRPFLPVLIVGLAGCAVASGPAPVVASQSTSTVERTAIPATPPPVEATAILHAIDGERMKADVTRLAAFGTRHTLSDTTSETRGIGAARRWIEAELARAGGSFLHVALEPHVVHADGKRIPRDVEIDDVVATLPGASQRRYYVVAHYDSRCTDVMDATSDAPGANDDASGIAVLLELARVLPGHAFDGTIVLLATAGEEQGLYGAKEHATTLSGVDVRAVLNNDIVGDPAGGNPRRVRVFSKGQDDSPSRELARFVADTAAWEGIVPLAQLVLRPDRILRGGDHLPFDDAGFPAVRFTASGEDYSRQHQNVRTEGGVSFGDTPEHVDSVYLAGVARLDAAAIIHLASAPVPPSDTHVVAELSRDAHLRWSPGTSVPPRGYEVVWRVTTSATWEHALDVGSVTEATLPLSKDDFFFGVRAYDARGYRSPVSLARPVAP